MPIQRTLCASGVQVETEQDDACAPDSPSQHLVSANPDAQACSVPLAHGMAAGSIGDEKDTLVEGGEMGSSLKQGIHTDQHAHVCKCVHDAYRAAPSLTAFIPSKSGIIFFSPASAPVSWPSLCREGKALSLDRPKTMISKDGQLATVYTAARTHYISGWAWLTWQPAQMSNFSDRVCS